MAHKRYDEIRYVRRMLRRDAFLSRRESLRIAPQSGMESAQQDETLGLVQKESLAPEGRPKPFGALTPCICADGIRYSFETVIVSNRSTNIWYTAFRPAPSGAGTSDRDANPGFLSLTLRSTPLSGAILVASLREAFLLYIQPSQLPKSTPAAAISSYLCSEIADQERNPSTRP